MGFSREDFKKYAYNGPVYNTIDESIAKCNDLRKGVDRKLRLAKKVLLRWGSDLLLGSFDAWFLNWQIVFLFK